MLLMHKSLDVITLLWCLHERFCEKAPAMAFQSILDVPFVLLPGMVIPPVIIATWLLGSISRWASVAIALHHFFYRAWPVELVHTGGRRKGRSDDVIVPW
jgi:hypothetical protein